MVYTQRFLSPLGGITLVSGGEALTGLLFDGQRLFRPLPAGAERALPVFAETVCWLETYFSGKAPAFTPKLGFSDTPFRREVWALLLTVPYGQTVTYGELAAELARQRGMGRMSAQAVGGAVAHNPISLIVPCHRVLGSDGSLTGYAGGLDRKRQLLDLEAAGRGGCADRRMGFDPL